MVSKGMIYNVPGKKGVYSTYEMTEQEAKKLFGTDGEADEPTVTGGSETSAPPPAAPPAPPPVQKPRHAFDKKFVSTTSIPRRIG